jgi:P2 family phage contractile tail tube protein
MVDELKGSGIGGTLSLPVAAHVQAMTCTINWHTLIHDMPVLFVQEKVQLEIYAAIQFQDTTLGKLIFKQFKCIIRGMPITMTLGTLEVGAKGGPLNEWAVEYLKGTMDGAEIFEIDPLNFIYTINGVDYAQDIRTVLGM